MSFTGKEKALCVMEFDKNNKIYITGHMSMSCFYEIPKYKITSPAPFQ